MTKIRQLDQSTTEGPQPTPSSSDSADLTKPLPLPLFGELRHWVRTVRGKVHHRRALDFREATRPGLLLIVAGRVTRCTSEILQRSIDERGVATITTVHSRYRVVPTTR